MCHVRVFGRGFWSSENSLIGPNLSYLYDYCLTSRWGMPRLDTFHLAESLSEDYCRQSDLSIEDSIVISMSLSHLKAAYSSQGPSVSAGVIPGNRRPGVVHRRQAFVARHVVLDSSGVWEGTWLHAGGTSALFYHHWGPLYPKDCRISINPYKPRFNGYRAALPCPTERSSRRLRFMNRQDCPQSGCSEMTLEWRLSANPVVLLNYRNEQI